MKNILTLWVFVLNLYVVNAQYVIVSGSVVQHRKPVEGVLILSFDKMQPLKAVITDAKGEYRFRTDAESIDVFFYKKGKAIQTASVRNKLREENQGIPLNAEMDDSSGSSDKYTYKLLRKMGIDTNYLDSVYAIEDFKLKNETRYVKQSRKEMLKAAQEEQKRFANYKTVTSDKLEGGQKDKVTTTTIGPDTYILIANENNEKKYTKNDKPISEYTYTFETTRRYTGVYKGSKNVNKFDKYKPIEHTKR
jgi:hypothetical protein